MGTSVENYLQTMLDGGGRIITEPLPSVRSAAIGVWIGAGSRDEDDAHAGLAHFLEHLLFKGTAKYSALEIAEIFDGMGGELNAATARDYTVVYARVLDEHIEAALDVMTDMVFAPAFAEIDAEREVVLEEIAMIEDTPPELVHDVFTETVFGDHPLGRPVLGSAEVIASVSRRAIGAYHRARYRPDNIVVAAAGSVEHDRLVEVVQDLAEKEHAAGARRPVARPPFVSPPPPSLRFVRKETEQYHICVGAPGLARSDRRRFTATVLDSILGGSASSRLFQEIREKRGLAYAVYTFASQYADTGQVGVYVGTREDNLVECMKVVAAELHAVSRDRPRGRGRAGEGEPEGPHHALDGADLEPHEPARQVARHRHGPALARPDPGRDRRRGRRVGGPARRRAVRDGAPVGRRDRHERGPLPRLGGRDRAAPAGGQGGLSHPGRRIRVTCRRSAGCSRSTCRRRPRPW